MISAIKLENQFNLDNMEIFEMNKELGGTWWSNSYPGSECDIPIHGYCITFEPRAGVFQMNYSFAMHNPFTLLFTLLSLSVNC
jgi:cation diffusion facilitator CzcD-associated flavoprotein CzcO